MSVVQELRQAYHCLSLEVPEAVAKDVAAKAEAVIRELEKNEFYIQCLHAGGVDNWDWYSESLQSYWEEYGDDA